MTGISHLWGNTCYWMAFDPDVKDKVWAVWAYAHDLPRPKMYGGWFRSAWGGVGKSTDGCGTWKTDSKGLPSNCVACHIVMDPASQAGNRTLYIAAFDKGVYKSVDDGETWALKNNGIAGSGNLNAFRLCLTPDGTLYAVVARGVIGSEEEGVQIDGALYQSKDGAETWRRLTLPRGVNGPNDIICGADDPNHLYLACWPRTMDGREYFGGVYASEDAGVTWRTVFDETAHVYGITADPVHPGRLFINTFDHAAYRSDDRGATWFRLGGYNFHWGHRPVVDAHNPDMLYLTTFGGSVWHGPADGVPGAVEDVVL